MRGARAAALLTIALLLLLAATAGADRKSTTKERKALAALIDLKPECARTRVSTVDERYGSVSFRPKSPERCQADASDGVTIGKKRNGRWKFVTAGSAFGCDELYREVPQAVAADLNIPCI